MSDPDAFGSLMIVFACLISSLMMLLYLASMIWVFIDAQAKGKTGCLWLLLVFFTWPFGLIAYLVLRNTEVRL